MSTKTISIMDDVYKLLVSRKNKDESFSDVIRKEFKKKKDITDFAGAWEDMSDKEAKDLKDNIRKFRKGISKGTLRKVKS